MYLYIFTDGSVKQVNDNPTIYDILALKQGLLSIYGFADEVFYKVVDDNGKLCRIKVKQADIIFDNIHRFHQ